MAINGCTPLHEATSSNEDFEVTQLLLESSSNPEAVDKENNTPLHNAAEKGSLNIVRILIEYSNDVMSYVNATNQKNETALHCAVKMGHSEVVEYLLENNCKVSEIDVEKHTELHYAAANGNSCISTLLLKYAVDVKTYANAHNSKKETALHLAARKGRFEVAKLLLENHSDIDAVDKDQNTILHFAAESGDINTIKLLLNYSKDIGKFVNTRNGKKQTPIHLAARRGKYEVVQQLLENLADVNLVDMHNNTILHFAAESGDISTFKILLCHVKDATLKASSFT